MGYPAFLKGFIVAAGLYCPFDVYLTALGYILGDEGIYQPPKSKAFVVFGFLDFLPSILVRIFVIGDDVQVSYCPRFRLPQLRVAETSSYYDYFVYAFLTLISGQYFLVSFQRSNACPNILVILP